MYQKTAAPETTVDPSIDFLSRYRSVRSKTEEICSYLKPEDHVVQPVVDVSPPKWHLAHTTWFFETFFLKNFSPEYKIYHADYAFLFNSYYEAEGERVLRPNRGNLSRPTVDEILSYRKYVDLKMIEALEKAGLAYESKEILELGLQHEMQHQELLVTDIKYIFGFNPIFPVYRDDQGIDTGYITGENGFLEIPAGIYQIGADDEGFHFDNESARHKVYLESFSIARNYVSYGEFIDFIEDGGYSNPALWHSDGWSWINERDISSPMYMFRKQGEWYRYTLGGLKPIDRAEVLMHVSFYEAFAYANWKGMRLPTEFEWEVAADHLDWGTVWEWTNSAYLPYPGFRPPTGALGEYNGKFMINQMVLRGASIATNPNQVRRTYRNFFQPELQWQFSGIRLVK
jgi:ergothioneine biosynthesis protein EgtB